MASPRRPSSPTITASILLQQQLSLSFPHPCGGCFGSGLPECPAASGTALGEQASILLRISRAPPASLSHLRACPSLAQHGCTLALPHSPRCLWCVCVCVCARVSDVVLSSCYTHVAGAWMGWDVACGQGLAGTPSLHVRHRSAWVSGHGKGFGILPEPLLVLLALPQLLGHLTALLQPKATAGLLLRPRVPGRRQLGRLGQAAHQTGDFYPHDPFYRPGS